MGSFLLDSYKLACQRLSLKDLWTVSCTCKTLNLAWELWLRTVPDESLRALLLEAIGSERTSTIPSTGLRSSDSFSEYLQPQHALRYQHIAWLLLSFSKEHGILPLAARLGLQEALVEAQGDPVLCIMLIKAGARVNYELIVSTAPYQPGPITWLRTYAFLGLSLDVPSLVSDLCLGREPPLQQLSQSPVGMAFTLTSLACSNSSSGPAPNPDAILSLCMTQAMDWSPDQVQQLIQLGLAAEYQANQAISTLGPIHFFMLIGLPAVERMSSEAKWQVVEAAARWAQNFEWIYSTFIQQTPSAHAVAGLFRMALSGGGPKEAFSLVYGGTSPLRYHDAKSDAALQHQLVLMALEQRNRDALSCLIQSSSCQLQPEAAMDSLIAAAQLGEKLPMSLIHQYVEKHCSHAILPPAAMELPASAILLLLEVVCSSSNVLLVQQLLRLPSAQQMEAEGVLQLLHCAAKGGTGSVLGQLEGLQGAKQHIESSMPSLLLIAIEASNYSAFAWLNALPAATILSLDSVTLLLDSAVGVGLVQAVRWLVARPLAERVSGGDVLKLLKAILQQPSNSSQGPMSHSSSRWRRESIVRLLLELPAVQDFAALDVESLLGQAVVLGSELSVGYLAGLSGISCVAADAVEPLMLQAILGGSVCCVKELVKLPQAAALSPDRVLQLLEAAVREESAEAVQWLTQLPGALHLLPGVVGVLAEVALQPGAAAGGRGFSWLVQLPAAQQFQSGVVVKLAELALKDARPQAEVRWLAEHPALQAATREQKLQLWEVAACVGHCLPLLFDNLLQGRLSSQEVVLLFGAAFQGEGQEGSAGLVLQAAAGVDGLCSCLVKELLLMAINANNSSAVSLLLQHASWADMSEGNIGQLLLVAAGSGERSYLQLFMGKALPHMSQEAAVLLLREYMGSSPTCSLGCCLGCKLLLHATSSELQLPLHDQLFLLAAAAAHGLQHLVLDGLVSSSSISGPGEVCQLLLHLQQDPGACTRQLGYYRQILQQHAAQQLRPQHTYQLVDHAVTTGQVHVLRCLFRAAPSAITFPLQQVRQLLEQAFRTQNVPVLECLLA